MMKKSQNHSSIPIEEFVQYLIAKLETRFRDENLYRWKRKTCVSKLYEKRELSEFGNALSSYAKTNGCANDLIELKKCYLRKYSSKYDLDTRIEFARLVIFHWGGIFNSYDTLKKYVSLPEQDLIQLDTGIASWSKFLAWNNPDKYFIYDSRVSVVLIVYWKQWCEENNQIPKMCPFQLAIGKSNKFKKIKHSLDCQKINYSKKNNNFYESYYCKLINTVANKLKINPHYVEMTLFMEFDTLVKTNDFIKRY